MTLLEDIQNAAVDGSSDLGTLLRKCKLLAARLGSTQLEDWLLWESNGYPDDVEVPDYRTWSLTLKGYFADSSGSKLENVIIPSTSIPEEVRQFYQRYEHRQSIATIEDLLERGDGTRLEVSTGDLAAALGMDVYEGMNCYQASATFGPSHFVELVNAVRNRILDFTLAIWKEDPTAGDIKEEAATTIEPAVVTQIFHTTVHGGAASIVGSAHDSTITFNVVANDFESLKKVLRENAVDDADIQVLKEAIDSDDTPESGTKFGPKVSTWIGDMMYKAASGTWEIGVGVAGTVLTQAITQYYGF